MVEKRFEKLGMPDIERFENYLPTAFNSELTLLQKVNKIIFDLNKNFELTNEMVDYLNKFIESFDEKLYGTIEDILNVWVEDGRLADVVRVAISEEVVEARTDYLGQTYLTLKERLDLERKEVILARGGEANLKVRLDKENQEINTQLTHIENNSIFLEEITVNTSEELIEAINNDNYAKITLRKGVYNIDGVLEITKYIDGKGSTIVVNSPFTTSASTKLKNISFVTSVSYSNNCINLNDSCKIENCNFSSFDTAIKQVGICVHGYIKNCIFQYNRNGIWLGCPSHTSMNNYVIENNYFVKHGKNADDLSANGTKHEMVGIGLYLEGGCNHVVIRENVFEYNTFCGIYSTNTSLSKTNDSKIISNYFEGNKITAVYVEFPGAANNQFLIRDSFYSPKMTTNADYIREDIVLNTANKSYNTLYGKQYNQILGTGSNLTFADDRSYVSLASQYISVPFDRLDYGTVFGGNCLVYMRYSTKLNSDVGFRDGTNTSLILHTFENSDGGIRSAIVSMPNNENKYTDRALGTDEYIRIYEYRLL